MTNRSLLLQILLLVVIVLFCLFPFYWMVTTSLKDQVVALASPPVWTFTPTFANYVEVLFEEKVKAYFRKTQDLDGNLKALFHGDSLILFSKYPLVNH